MTIGSFQEAFFVIFVVYQQQHFIPEKTSDSAVKGFLYSSITFLQFIVWFILLYIPYYSIAFWIDQITKFLQENDQSIEKKMLPEKHKQEQENDSEITDAIIELRSNQSAER